MFTKSTLMIFKAIAPIHAGSGQDLGIVDMPIQREKHTGIPKIEGSGVKGVFREYFEEKSKLQEEIGEADVNVLFGPEGGKDYAAALGFSDARLLFFPVRSLEGIFALVTCPYVLERLLEDFKICQQKQEYIEKLKSIIEYGKKIHRGKCYLNDDKCLVFNDNVFLEEYMFDKEDDYEIKEKVNSILCDFTLNEEIKKRIVILTDGDFIDFVTMHTEIITRNRIKRATGTTDDTALFTEEYLPAESILYTLILASDRKITEDDKKYNAKENLKIFIKNKPELLQIGGNATIGKGIVKVFCADSQEGDTIG